MNNDDIIRMAREAGASSSGISLIIGIEDFFERFAALVAAAERKKIELDGIHTCSNECQRPACVAVREAVAAEREACAKVCEECGSIVDGLTPKDCADAIRARSRQ
jgi:hypothetical protein